MRTRRTSLLLPLLLVASLTVTAVSLAADGSLDVELRDGRVSLVARAAGLREVLQTIADRAHFKLWISRELPPQQVTVEITQVPVADALDRLLAANSFALVYGADGAVSALYLVPTGESQPTRTVLDSETAIIREQVLQNALASKAVPDHLKAAMLSQHYGESEEFRQSVSAQRPQAIRRLIDSLQQLGEPSAETLQRLERTLQPEAGLNNE